MYALLLGGAVCLNNAKITQHFFSPSQLKKFQGFFHFYCLSKKKWKKKIKIVNKMPKW